jgi:hypothetical protein
MAASSSRPRGVFLNLYEFTMSDLCGIYVLSNPMKWMRRTAAGKEDNRMLIQEVSPERFAQLFHHYHEALAGEPENATKLRTKEAWERVPATEKSRLIAAARLALLEVEVLPRETPSRRYFAKPGEAEWGC